MTRRKQAVPFLKWAGAFLTSIVGAAWIWSYCDTSIHDLGSIVSGSDPGGILIIRAFQLGDGECNFTYDFSPDGLVTMNADFIDLPWLKVNGESTAFSLQLWIPFVILAISTTILCLSDRKRVPPGHCGRCGYNLLGNVTGVCPECGTSVEVRTLADP